MVMTRCFGWTLPATMIVPFADFQNHSDAGCTHYVINTKFEENEEQAPTTYVLKKRKIDLSLFGNEKLILCEDDKEIFFLPTRSGLEYTKKNLVSIYNFFY